MTVAVELFLKAMTSRVGCVLIAVAVVVFLYEGVPIGPLRYIPYVGPVLADITNGRVDRVRDSAHADAENEARARAMALIQKKSEDHEELSTADNATLCGELGGRWVPNEARCD